MIYWMWLNGIEHLGPVIAKRLLDVFNSPENIFKAEMVDLLKVPGVGEVLGENIVTSKDLSVYKRQYELLCNKNIKVLTYENEMYPSFAKIDKNAPLILYYKGNLKPMNTSVGIVGSRRCSNYGKKVAEEIGGFLGGCGIPVISGMAKGIDSYAQMSCIKNGGYTIAFLAYGINHCYPKEHQSLLDSICENGAAISEYLPDVSPRKAFFAKRNALIAGWSSKILVIEAGEKSGALITADWAKKFEKPLFVVPQNIDSAAGKGSNKLLLDGGSLCLSPKQLIDGGAEFSNEICDLNKCNNIIQNIDINESDLSELEIEILKMLENKALTSSQIQKKLTKRKEIQEIMQCLSILEIEGYIKCNPRGRFWEAVIK